MRRLKGVGHEIEIANSISVVESLFRGNNLIQKMAVTEDIHKIFEKHDGDKSNL